MIKIIHTATIASLLLAPVSTIAQTTNAPAARPQAQPEEIYIPAGTQLVVSNNSKVTTKGGAIDEGDRFYLSTVYDVLIDGIVAIPAGSAVTAEVTWKTGKAVFGKSGKFDFEMRHVDVGGQRIPLTGKFRQEGSGNTAATVGAVVATFAVGAGFFITGKSGELPAGRQFEITTAVGASVRNRNYVEVEQNSNSQAGVQEMRVKCLALGFEDGSENFQQCILELIRQ